MSWCSTDSNTLSISYNSSSPQALHYSDEMETTTLGATEAARDVTVNFTPLILS